MCKAANVPERFSQIQPMLYVATESQSTSVLRVCGLLVLVRGRVCARRFGKTGKAFIGVYHEPIAVTGVDDLHARISRHDVGLCVLATAFMVHGATPTLLSSLPWAYPAPTLGTCLPC